MVRFFLSHVVLLVFAFSCADNQYAAYKNLLEESEESRYLKARIVPRSGEEGVPVGGVVRLIFNKEPDKVALGAGELIGFVNIAEDGTEERISLALDRLVKDTGDNSWQAVFQPERELDYEGVYEFRLAKELQATDGYGLKDSIVSRFTTYAYVDAFRVVRTVPSGGSGFIEPDTDIEVHFSTAVNHSSFFESVSIYSNDVSLPINKEASEKATEIANAEKAEDVELYKVIIVLNEGITFDLAGEGKIVVGEGIYAKSAEILPDGRIKDLRQSLPSSYESVFSIVEVSSKLPPRVETFYPSDGEEGIPPRTYINVLFSQRVTAESVRASSKLYKVGPDGEETPHGLRLEGRGRAYSFYPEPQLDLFKGYRFSLSSNVMNKRELKLDIPLSVSFKTARSLDNRPLSVLSTSPEEGTKVASPSVVSVQFSHAMKQESSSAGIILLRGEKTNNREISAEMRIPVSLSWDNSVRLRITPLEQPLTEGGYTIRVIHDQVKCFRDMNLDDSYQATFYVASGATPPPKLETEPKISLSGCEGDMSVSWEMDYPVVHRISFGFTADFRFNGGILYPESGRTAAGIKADILVRGLMKKIIQGNGGNLEGLVDKSRKIEIFYKIRSTNAENPGQFFESKAKKIRILQGLVAPEVEAGIEGSVCSGSEIDVLWKVSSGYSYKAQWGLPEVKDGLDSVKVWRDIDHKVTGTQAKVSLAGTIYRGVDRVAFRVQPSVMVDGSLCERPLDVLVPKYVLVHKNPEAPAIEKIVLGCVGGSVELEWSEIKGISGIQVEIEDEKKVGSWKETSLTGENLAKKLKISLAKDISDEVEELNWRLRTYNPPCTPSEYVKGNIQLNRNAKAPRIPDLSPVCEGTGSPSFTWESGNYARKLSLLITSPLKKETEQLIWDASASKIGSFRSKEVNIPEEALKEAGTYVIQLKVESGEPCTVVAKSNPGILEVVSDERSPELNEVASACFNGSLVGSDAQEVYPVDFSWLFEGKNKLKYGLTIYKLDEMDWLSEGITTVDGALLGLGSLENGEEHDLGDKKKGTYKLEEGFYAWMLGVERISQKGDSPCEFGEIKSEEPFWVGTSLGAVENLESLAVGGSSAASLICAAKGDTQASVELKWEVPSGFKAGNTWSTMEYTIEFDGPIRVDGIYRGTDDKVSIEVKGVETVELMSMDPGRYSWRVKAHHKYSILGVEEVCDSPYSTPSFFTVATRPDDVTAFTSPNPGLATICASTGFPLSHDVTWLGSGADRYIFSLDENSDGDYSDRPALIAPHAGGNRTSPQRVNLRGLQAQSYGFRVIAINGSSGESGCDSDPTDRTYTFSSLPQPATLKSPLDGDFLCATTVGALAGVTLEWNRPAGDTGFYELSFDGDGDGDYIDPASQTITLASGAAGTYTWPSVPSGGARSPAWKVVHLSDASAGACRSAELSQSFSFSSMPAAFTNFAVNLSGAAASNPICLDFASSLVLDFDWRRAVGAGVPDGIALDFDVNSGFAAVASSAIYGQSTDRFGGALALDLAGSARTRRVTINPGNTDIGTTTGGKFSARLRGYSTFSGSSKRCYGDPVTSSPISILRKPPVPVLVSPANNKQVCAGANMSLRWRFGAIPAGVTYSSAFYREGTAVALSSTPARAVAGTSEIVTAGISGTEIHWKVKAKHDVGGLSCMSDDSAVRVVEVLAGSSSTAPVPSSSAVNICLNATAAAELFNLSWTAKSGVAGYEVMIYDTASGTPVRSAALTGKTTHIVLSGTSNSETLNTLAGLSAGNYEWSIRSYGATVKGYRCESAESTKIAINVGVTAGASVAYPPPPSLCYVDLVGVVVAWAVSNISTVYEVELSGGNNSTFSSIPSSAVMDPSGYNASRNERTVDLPFIVPVDASVQNTYKWRIREISVCSSPWRTSSLIFSPKISGPALTRKPLNPSEYCIERGVTGVDFAWVPNAQDVNITITNSGSRAFMMHSVSSTTSTSAKSLDDSSHFPGGEGVFDWSLYAMEMSGSRCVSADVEGFNVKVGFKPSAPTLTSFSMISLSGNDLHCVAPGGTAGTSISVPFSWTHPSPVAAREYQVELSVVSGIPFVTSAWGSAMTDSISIPYPYLGIYDWIVRARSTVLNTCDTSSTTRVLNIREGVAAPVIAASMPTHVCAYASVDFEWNAVAGATSYEIDFDTNMDGIFNPGASGDVVTVTEGAGATIHTANVPSPAPSLRGFQTFKWRIRAIGAAGIDCNYSSWTEGTIEILPETGIISISTPPGNSEHCLGTSSDTISFTYPTAASGRAYSPLTIAGNSINYTMTLTVHDGWVGGASFKFPIPLSSTSYSISAGNFTARHSYNFSDWSALILRHFSYPALSLDCHSYAMASRPPPLPRVLIAFKPPVVTLNAPAPGISFSKSAGGNVSFDWAYPASFPPYLSPVEYTVASSGYVAGFSPTAIAGATAVAGGNGSSSIAKSNFSVGTHTWSVRGTPVNGKAFTSPCYSETVPRTITVTP